MAQKKSSYWDQIFANQVQETDDVSKEEENVLDFTGKTPNQEHDVRVREIFFAEEGAEDEFPAPIQSKQENEITVTSADDEETVEIAEAVEPTETVDSARLDANSDAHTENESEDDLFFGWTQTTKSYSQLNFEGKEPVKAEPEEPVVEEVAEYTSSEEEAEVNTVEAEAEKEVETDETSDETEDETVEEAEVSASKPILSEDGFLSVKLNRYEHPTKGFGFGLLDEETEESDENAVQEEAVSEVIPETAEVETEAEEIEVEECKETAPAGLDSWGSLAFELGLPVTLPENTVETKAPKDSTKEKNEVMVAKPAKEERPARTRKSEKTPKVEETKTLVNLEDEDFVSPENVFAEPEKEGRLSRTGNRGRGHREERDSVSDFGMDSIVTPEMSDSEEDEAPRRRRRRVASAETSVSEKKSAAIGGIVAGVVASKMKDEKEKTSRKAGKTARLERSDRQEEAGETLRNERSRRSRRMVTEEIPQDDFQLMEDEESKSQITAVDEDDYSEIPNGARSRRRRRSQHEKLEQGKGKVSAVVEEDDEDEDSIEEVSVFAKHPRRSGRNRFHEDLEDEKEIWGEVEVDEEEEDDEEEVPHNRRSRRPRRPSGKNSSLFDSEEQDEEPEDEEEHVFTEVMDDEEEDEDEEWETDFSQHDVPGWRYTIDFIVNSNLKARKREPSSMAGNIARINKKGGKRK